jgi:hypothetical protein
MPNGIGMVEPEDPVGREDKGRGAWRYPSSYSPAVSIGAWANRGPMRVDGNGVTVETNGDPVGTNGEHEPEPLCTGAGKAGAELDRARIDHFFSFHLCPTLPLYWH